MRLASQEGANVLVGTALMTPAGALDAQMLNLQAYRVPTLPEEPSRPTPLTH
jgi:hypothetical protein